MYVENTSGGKQMPFHKLSVDGTNIYVKSLGVPKYCYTVGLSYRKFSFCLFLSTFSALSESRDFW